MPAKYEAPTEFYECDDCSDFPEDMYEVELEAQRIKFEKEEADRKKVNKLKIEN